MFGSFHVEALWTCVDTCESWYASQFLCETACLEIQ